MPRKKQYTALWHAWQQLRTGLNAEAEPYQALAEHSELRQKNSKIMGKHPGRRERFSVLFIFKFLIFQQFFAIRVTKTK
jgi:hypothetical protein